MRRVFVDTSAIFALLVEEDEAHQRARLGFSSLAAEEAVLVTSSYVLLECYALLGRRFGPEAMRRFRQDFVPLLEPIWVEAELHEHALDDLLARQVRDLSLVDAVSFSLIRAQKLDAAFAYDRHFEAEGIPLVGVRSSSN